MFTMQYHTVHGMHLSLNQSSHAHHFLITKCLRTEPKASWWSPRPSKYSHRICNNVTWFRNLNATNRHTEAN